MHWPFCCDTLSDHVNYDAVTVDVSRSVALQVSSDGINPARTTVLRACPTRCMMPDGTKQK